MREAPTYTSWKITCGSAEDAQALQQWLSSRIALDRIITDTVRVMPNGVEHVQTVAHRLGDYFADIRLVAEAPASFRLVFQRRPDAGRFWKDLMVNILQEIETAPQKSTIAIESKGDRRGVIR
jgi:hypothetical protein